MLEAFSYDINETADEDRVSAERGSSNKRPLF
jgi:hypothetical protein